MFHVFFFSFQILISSIHLTRKEKRKGAASCCVIFYFVVVVRILLFCLFSQFVYISFYSLCPFSGCLWVFFCWIPSFICSLCRDTGIPIRFYTLYDIMMQVKLHIEKIWLRRNVIGILGGGGYSQPLITKFYIFFKKVKNTLKLSKSIIKISWTLPISTDQYFSMVCLEAMERWPNLLR